jgi:hypothetical protein
VEVEDQADDEELDAVVGDGDSFDDMSDESSGYEEEFPPAEIIGGFS